MKSWKNIAIIVLVIFVAGLIYSNWRFYKKQKDDALYYASSNDSLKRVVDKQGREHATKLVDQVPLEVYNNTKDSFIAEIAKTTKAKDLVQHTRATIAVKGAFKTKAHDTVYIALGDTISAKSFQYSDGYLTFDGTIENYDVYGDYDIRVPFTMTHKWMRDKWYEKKKLKVEGVSENPKATFENIQTMVVKQPPKKFYETRAFAYGLGLISGFIIRQKIN